MSSATRRGLEIVAAALLLGALADALLHGTPLGLNVPLWTVAFVGALAALAVRHGASLRGDRALMLGALVLFSALFVWRDSPALASLNATALLTALAVGALRDPAARARLASLGDYARGYGEALEAAVAGGAVLVFGEIRWPEVARGAAADRAAAVLRGLLIAVPLLVLFGALFAAADAVFSDLLGLLVPELSRPFDHALFVLAGAWISAGLLRRYLQRPAPVEREPRDGRVGATETVVALVLVNALFLAFVLVQLRYLFGGASLVETDVGLTYAEYARRGFFELVAVTALALALLLVADWALRRGRRRDERLFRVLAAALLLLVAVVMVSALQRLRLYQREYGLTELRLYATAFVLWLAVVLGWFAGTVLRGRRHLFAGGAVAAALAAIVVLNAVNPDAVIARVNVDRAAERRPVDLAYLLQLSDDAAPTLARALPGLEAARAEHVGPPHVAATLLARACPAGRDWRSWNVGRERADRAVREAARALRALAGPLAPPC
ncbi:MAG: DUF4173 domain-containing protein [Thermoleophilia bacterium]|nr:DUF4173 domain-containing protein [Thermoleophilia bacterium]